MLSTSVHSAEIQSLYTFGSISEIVLALVHNSIDAFATRIQVKIDVDNWTIFVKDNSSGFVSLDHVGEAPILSTGTIYGKSGKVETVFLNLALYLISKIGSKLEITTRITGQYVTVKKTVHPNTFSICPVASNTKGSTV
jgi:hypothetical protein